MGLAQDRLGALEKTRFLAYHDPLTGLPNRAKLLEGFCLLWGRWVFCRLEFPDLQEVNEAYGREAGDAFLHLLAERLKGLLPREGGVYRLEGGEFLVLLPEGVEAVRAFEEALGRALEAPLDLGEGRAWRARYRVGVALLPEDGGRPPSSSAGRTWRFARRRIRESPWSFTTPSWGRP